MMLKFLGLLIQLIISPAKGWEDIAAKGDDPRKICADGFYPLLGITASTVFIRHFYDIDAGLIELVQRAIITFIAYFASYFFASFMFSVFGRSMVEGELNEKKYHTYIIYNLSLLAVISIISNCIPMELSVVQFLPVFVLLVMWMGARYMCIKENSGVKYIFLSTISILLPPYVLEFLFRRLLLHA